MSSNPPTQAVVSASGQESDSMEANPASTNDTVISINNVGKCYEIYAKPSDRLKQALWRGRRQLYREFWALRNISFEVRRGEAMGIIGRNGSGKSTLLQIIAGTLRCTEGEIKVDGRVHALLELGSGFNPEFTGRENVFLNGAILGLSQREVEERFDSIAGFADIGSFLDQPIKTYSTGMVVRLAFAVQVQLEPDVLIVDEALAVGDSLFQKRCFQKMEQLREAGLTLLFVSHDQESIRTLTSRTILLDGGCTRAIGSSAEVVLEYRRLLHDQERQYYENLMINKAPPPPPPPASKDGEDKRSDSYSFGDLDAEVVKVEVMDRDRQSASLFHPGESVILRIHVRVNRELTRLNVGFRIRSKEGVKIYSWGTFNQDVRVWKGFLDAPVFWDRRFKEGQVVTVEFECDCPLGQNFYEVQALVAEERMKYYGSQRMLHWRDEAAFFNVSMVTDRYFFGGICDLRAKAAVLDG